MKTTKGKIVMLLGILICLTIIVQGVSAAAGPTYNDVTGTPLVFYANCTPITIELVGGNTSVSWEGGTGPKVVDETWTIFGGSKDDGKCLATDSTSIIMNGGTVRAIFGGSDGSGTNPTSTLANTYIELNDADMIDKANTDGPGSTGNVYGGSYGKGEITGTATIELKDGSYDYIHGAGLGETTGTTSVNTTNKVVITTSGGTFHGIYGSGSAIQTTNEVLINFCGGETSTQPEDLGTDPTASLDDGIYAAGANGTTGKAVLNIGGEACNVCPAAPDNSSILHAAAVMRGVVGDSKINIADCADNNKIKVFSVYAGSNGFGGIDTSTGTPVITDTDASTGAVTNTAELNISGGDVSNASLGGGLNGTQCYATTNGECNPVTSTKPVETVTLNSTVPVKTWQNNVTELASGLPADHSLKELLSAGFPLVYPASLNGTHTTDNTLAGVTTLVVPADSEVEVPPVSTLTNNGTINNSGTINNQGSLTTTKTGRITGTGTTNGDWGAIVFADETITDVDDTLEYIIDDSASAPTDWTDAPAGTGDPIDISASIPAAGEESKYIHIHEITPGTGPVSTHEIPARPAAPTAAAAVAPTMQGGTDGKITGLASTMQYKIGTGEWTDVEEGTTEITDLAPETIVLVRTKAADSAFASASQSLTVPAGTATGTVTFDMQGHGNQVTQLTDFIYGSKVTKPADPAANGYIFGGWYKEAACTNQWNFDIDTITQLATTLYAKWAPLQPMGPEFFPLPGFFNDQHRMPGTGFASANFTTLKAQPRALEYADLRLKISIPTLNVDTSILEVPEEGESWAVEWLGANIGLLSGSAKPGEGISYMAGHNHLNTTEAGPFLALGSLAENDRIFITAADGTMQSFRIFANDTFEAADGASVEEIAAAHQKALVLITCENESIDGGYTHRRVVFAEPC